LADQDILARAVGRRKSSIARVRLLSGEGRIVINDKEHMTYLGQKRLEQVIMRPLRLTENQRRFNVSVKVEGGGVSGQAGAIAHAISRALIGLDPDLRPPLKKDGLLTRDPRVKERKKYGLKRARKAPQYTKR
jgi:small subunit ribosomal protein S9